MENYLNQNDDGSFRHFTFKVRLSGDTRYARLFLAAAEKDLFAMKRSMILSGIDQQYRSDTPAPGVEVKLSIVGMVRIIEIYAPPVYGEKEQEEERPCFCNCCFSECQIVKVDGTWRSESHPDVPLPYLGYQHGDRRLRYDIDVCSFLGLDPESGLTVHEFYRVENVMPSDFTPYEVGDWAMVYFIDTVRSEKCGEGEDCKPRETDDLGEINGCGQRDVLLYANQPQCIIVPISFKDRPSRGSVLTRDINSFRKGVCVKRANIDWVQYSFPETGPEPEPGTRPYSCRPGSANITWSAWTSAYPSTIIHDVPIHYCDQDGFTDNGSHAFRAGDWVYVMIEGDSYTILGRSIETLWYYGQYGIPTVHTVTPAILMMAIVATGKGHGSGDTGSAWWSYYYSDADSAPVSGESAPVPELNLAVYWDITHDCQLSFSRYSWNEDDIRGWNPSGSTSLYLAAYFSRGAASTPSYNWGAPTSGTKFPSVAVMAGYGKIQSHWGFDGVSQYTNIVSMGLDFDHVFEAGYDYNKDAVSISNSGLMASGSIPSGIMRIRFPDQYSSLFMTGRYRSSPYDFKYYETLGGTSPNFIIVEQDLRRNCRSDFDIKLITGAYTQWDVSQLCVSLNGFPTSSITFPPVMATVTRSDTARCVATRDLEYEDQSASTTATESTSIDYKLPGLSTGVTVEDCTVIETCSIESTGTSSCSKHTGPGYNEWSPSDVQWSSAENFDVTDCMLTAVGGVSGMSSMSCRWASATWETARQELSSTGSFDMTVPWATQLASYFVDYPIATLYNYPGDNPLYATFLATYNYAQNEGGSFPQMSNHGPIGGGGMNSCIGAGWYSPPLNPQMEYFVDDYATENWSGESAWMDSNLQMETYHRRDKGPLYQSRSGIKRAVAISMVELSSRRNDPMRHVLSADVGGISGGAVRDLVLPRLNSFLEEVALGASAIPVLHPEYTLPDLYREYMDGWFDMTLNHKRFLTYERNVNGYYYKRSAVPYRTLVDAQYQISAISIL